MTGDRLSTLAFCWRVDRPDGAGVALEVEDDGATAPTSNDGGAGLAGLAERARHLHGTLEAAARPEGGFSLRLTLPLRAA